ncbi:MULTISPECIES: hypothetical protein [Bacillus cereus group]|uniref:Uncharacterized protein n=2 Tax=Bacteria TaxID=2 RepID=A0A9W5Q181_BACCE|nr:hypothetical protein [Bacillus cereus]EOO64599.1 hypothetical protein IKE_04139 [Bacillus cereus VD196]MBM6771313.1 hypothetical protein [Bacillus cereus]MDZ4484816.1 hypothetical protein [Bacillus cereus]
MELEEVKKNLDKETKDLIELATTLNYDINNINLIYNNFSTNINDLILFEDQLNQFADHIRRNWFNLAHLSSSKLYKSPDITEKIMTPNNTELNYGYERCLSPKKLENRIHMKVENWEGFSLLYSSAMAALTSLLNGIRKFYKKKNSIKGIFLGSYFENYHLIDNFNSVNMNITKIVDTKQLKEKNYIHDLDFMIIEPVKYNLNLETINLEDLIEVLKYKPDDKILFLIFDTTLLSGVFEKEKFFKKISSIKNIFFIEIKSCLKLDQHGLEFSNSGLMSVYTNKNLISLMGKLHEFFEGFRSIYGSGLSFNQVCLLDFNGFNQNTTYPNAILKNNELFAKSINIKPNSIIEKVIHPSLDYDNFDEYKMAPFLFLKIKNPNDFKCNLFIEIIKYELQKININIKVSNSFGFRQTRMQYIKTVEQKPNFVIKIAVGKIKGIMFYKLIEIINNLAEIENFNAFQNIYPSIYNNLKNSNHNLNLITN